MQVLRIQLQGNRMGGKMPGVVFGTPELQYCNNKTRSQVI